MLQIWNHIDGEVETGRSLGLNGQPVKVNEQAPGTSERWHLRKQCE